MSVLRAALDLSNTRESAIWAVACTAWRDCARLGEVLVDSASAFNPDRHVTRGCPKRRGVASNRHKFVGFKVSQPFFNLSFDLNTFTKGSMD
jgi:hypothetical protein